MLHADTFCDTIFINILTNMEFNFSEPEEIISALVNQHGVKISTIEKRLGLKRTELMSMRRSTKPHTKKTLAEKIISAFPEYLSEASFWYHVEQCKECQQKVSAFLKTKNKQGGGVKAF